MARILPVPCGPAALAALSSALRGRAPLDPALVIAPGPLVAVSLRRSLGSSSTSGGRGVAGIDVVTIAHLIDRLSAGPLADQGAHTATSMELQVAIRAELEADPGLFGEVATHPTTVDRLLHLDAELSGLPARDIDRMSRAGGLGGEAVRVLAAAFRRLGDARNASQVADLALEALADVTEGELGPIIVYLPEPIRPVEGRVLAALAQRDDCTMLVGLTGHPDIDRRHVSLLDGWGIQASTAAGPIVVVEADARPRGHRVDVADPEDEVRAALRVLVAHAAAGTPLNRMALLYTAADPYAAIIDDHLAAGELPWAAPGHRTLSGSPSGRTLLRLLDLVAAGEGIDRAALIALLSGAPLRHPRRRQGPIPASLWDDLSRQAGVVGGADWRPRLERLAAQLAPGHPHREAVADLTDFVDVLGQHLRTAPAGGTWRQWGDWVQQVLSELVIRDDTWPEAQRAAVERVDELLGRLRLLDTSIVPGPSGVGVDAFRSLVASELDRGVIPGRPAGRGLVVAPLGAASGLVFDRVAIVGLAEGLFPRSPRDDSLLPDQVRSQAGGMLLTRTDRQPLDVRSVAVAVASAPGRSLLTLARGDLRSKRSRAWPVALDDLVDAHSEIASHHRGMAEHGRPVTLDDVGLRSLVNHVEGGDPVDTHPLASLDPALAAGLARHRDRSRSDLTTHTGLVNTPARLENTPTSPTGLETYAACPRRFLFGRVLRLGDEERPERLEEISPRERGSLLHRILERFVADALAADTIPAPGEPWSENHEAHLDDILAAEVSEAADLGLTGGRVSTEILRRALRRELDAFLAKDTELRADRRSTPVGVEVSFGLDDEPAVVRVGDGRRLLLRGSVDRVDLTDDDGMLVIDYKGGSDRAFTKIDTDPLSGGRRLQLPLYTRVLAERLGRNGPRSALYWLTKTDRTREMVLDDDLDAQLDEHLAAALDGIDAGLFPGVPGGRLGFPRLTFENCQWCDFDPICPTDRQREWDAVAGDPALTPVELLLGRER